MPISAINQSGIPLVLDMKEVDVSTAVTVLLKVCLNLRLKARVFLPCSYPCFENPYPMDIHESPVTACQYFADCPTDLIPAFYSVGAKQKRTEGFSEKVHCKRRVLCFVLPASLLHKPADYVAPLMDSDVSALPTVGSRIITHRYLVSSAQTGLACEGW